MLNAFKRCKGLVSESVVVRNTEMKMMKIPNWHATCSALLKLFHFITRFHHCHCSVS